jgi:L-lactate dehydrogenase
MQDAPSPVSQDPAPDGRHHARAAPGSAGPCVGIVGAGHVGMAAAYAIFQQRLAHRLVLVDKDTRRAEGEAMDLMHAQGYVGRRSVTSGSYADLAGAAQVIVTAGANQRPGESRLALFERNVAIMRDVVAGLDRHAPDATVLVASNPVDLMTWVVQELSARPRTRVIGTGTMLDTTRFRALLAEHYGVDPRSVHAYIVGEHGDSEVPVWSSANIAGVPLRHSAPLGRPFDAPELGALFERVRGAAEEIIGRKGYTNWAIGLVIAHLLRAVRDDLRSVLPVSVRLDGEYGLSGVCLSLPTLVGADGAGARVLPALDGDEQEALRRSANVLNGHLAQLRLAVLRR